MFLIIQKQGRFSNERPHPAREFHEAAVIVARLWLALCAVLASAAGRTLRCLQRPARHDKVEPVDELASQPALAPCGNKYAALVRAAAGCAIPQTELRGITLQQLREAFTLASALCIADGWLSTGNGAALTPATITLYDLVAHLIKPATAARRCSYVELVAASAQSPT
jgi:hypothetical protein